MESLTQQQIEALIQFIDGAEDPATVTNTIVAAVLAFFADKTAGMATAKALLAEIAARQTADTNLSTSITQLQQLIQSLGSVVYLDSMGEELDGTPVHIDPGMVIYDPDQSTIKKCTAPDVYETIGCNENVLYCNKVTNIFYRWSTRSLNMIQVGAAKIKVINNLTEGGEEDALSAEMGKRLNESIEDRGIRALDNSDADLAFADEHGNVALQLNGGHVEAKHFNSRQVATNTADIQQLKSQIGQGGGGSVQTDVVVKEDNDATLDFADTAGNVVLRVAKDGQIKTKAFDSSAISVVKQTKIDKPQCICHGYGAVSGAANSISYFRNAVALGYEAFEVDAVNCSDGIPVCTHSYSVYTVLRKSDGQTVELNFSEIESNELINGYTWPDGEPIALLTEVIWYLCYVKRFPLFVDGQGMNNESRKYVSDYAESIGVGEYVIHFFPSGNAPTNWPRLNAVLYPGSVDALNTMYTTYKKTNNVLFFSVYYKTDELKKALSDAARALGCHTISWTLNSSESVREQMKLGIDYLITGNGITNDKI